MKYKVDHNSKLYAQLKELIQSFIDATEERKAFCKSVGATAFSNNNTFAIVGPINGIRFPQEPDKKMWRSVGPKYMELYMPKAKNKEALDALAKLPNISEDVYQSIFGPADIQIAENDNTVGLFRNPGLKVAGDDYLLSVPTSVTGYKPLPGMIEILESEYHLLLENHSKKTAEAGN